MSVFTMRRAGILAAAAALAITASGCAKSDSGETTAGGVKLVKSGQLTVCTNLPYAPFQFQDQNRKVVGLDVDLIDLVAKKLKVEQQIVNTPFETIRSGQSLKTGKCDIAAAGMTITDERKQVMDFSDPYFDATQALLVKKDAPYRSLADLRGKRVGSQAATTGLDYVRARAAQFDLEIPEFEHPAQQQQALASGRIDAAVNDLPVWSETVKKNPEFRIAEEFDTGEQYGFGLAKGGNPELLKLLNETLAEAHGNGTYAEIYEKWIGKPPAEQ
jgi:polar amino acid transport system substrate-binding protein